MSLSLLVKRQLEIKKKRIKKKLEKKQKLLLPQIDCPNIKIKEENKENKENKKVALIFWGLARSLKYTLESLKENVFKVLKENNFEYKIFFHTYFLKETYNNRRAGEKNIKLDNQEYKLLNPDYFIYDWQEDELKKLNVSQYYPKVDPWFNNYDTFRNYVLALNSQKKITQLFLEHQDEFDYVIYLRPDVKFLDKLDLSFKNLSHEKIIITPSFHKSGGINDRFAIMKPELVKIYGFRFDTLIEKDSLSSEKKLLKIFKKHLIENLEINFKFQRIRADGKVFIKDINL